MNDSKRRSNINSNDAKEKLKHNISEILKYLLNKNDDSFQFQNEINLNRYDIVLANLVITFFSDFQYNLNENDDLDFKKFHEKRKSDSNSLNSLNDKDENIIYDINLNSHQLANDMLILSNTKFLITPGITEAEFLNFILYFLYEFEVLDSYLDFLNFINKTLQINIENIFELLSSKNSDFFSDNTSNNLDYKDNNMHYEHHININLNKNKNYTHNNFLINFNKLNHLCKNLKKQIDSLINLSYKVNELIKLQPPPIK
jgi:hypothetical protein